MFEDWMKAVASRQVDDVDDATLRTWLAGAARMRSSLDAFEARIAAKLGDASRVRGATRCTQREADRAVARGALIGAAPDVGVALASGAISAGHVDTLARAAERTSLELVAASGLLEVAKAKPADAMHKQVSEFVRRESDDSSHVERLRRQRQNRRAFLLSAEMGVLHVEWDDVTFSEVKAAIDQATNRAYVADGGRDGADNKRTSEQRCADVIAQILTGAPGAEERSRNVGPPAVRNQMIVVAKSDGGAEIPGVGPLPRSEVERLACISDLYGQIFSSEGQPLWHGQRVRLADDNQWRALIARDGGCVSCGAHPSRCEAHHVAWTSNGGATDIDNLVLLCRHHHHLVHDEGWRVSRDGCGQWALAPP